MNALFKLNTQGIPLTLLPTQNYSTWLQQQSESHLRWLAATDYNGEGLSLIPAADGTIELAVFGASDLDQPFCCGDLINQLPEGDYQALGDEAHIKNLALSWGAGAYRFDRYTEKTAATASLVLPSQAHIDDAERFISAISLVRDLINTPAGDMMPEHISVAAEALAKNFGADVHQIIGDDLLAQNYPTIHAVGRASVHSPRLIDLRWGNKEHPKVTLVGKGVCFDSGGLDMKSPDGMRNMKKDMGGAAHVLGLAQLIMAYQLPVHLRVLIPAVENAVASNAYHPGDVIKTRKGITVEIDNTDAEGRLILCDALAEADTEQPELLLDFATLTGAARVALGTDLPGFFCNQPTLAQQLISAGDTVHDPIWQLPLFQPYRSLLKSEVADMVNRCVGQKGAAIAAALYLESFVEDTPWAHFDINAWNTSHSPGKPVGGEAVAIRAVFHYLQQRYSAA